MKHKHRAFTTLVIGVTVIPVLVATMLFLPSTPMNSHDAPDYLNLLVSTPSPTMSVVRYHEAGGVAWNEGPTLYLDINLSRHDIPKIISSFSYTEYTPSKRETDDRDNPAWWQDAIRASGYKFYQSEPGSGEIRELWINSLEGKMYAKITRF